MKRDSNRDQDVVPVSIAAGRPARDGGPSAARTDIKTILAMENVTKHFRSVRAVDGVSFEIKENETVSIVGESGCGKTTTAKLVLRLEKVTSGVVRFKGDDVEKLKRRRLRDYRSSVQAVMQDPSASLNPRLRIGTSVEEPLAVNTGMSRKERQERVGELLEQVGLEAGMTRDFPHEFSGGQRQRIAIARALALNPQVVVCDEPVSALDVSIRAQIMNLLRDLQEEYGLSYLVIAHDLATVRYLGQRVIVMYLGQIVESAKADDLFGRPLHPYTQALVSAARRSGKSDTRVILEGDVPSPESPPSGCRFHTRCPYAFEQCRVEEPELRELEAGHMASCHLY